MDKSKILILLCSMVSLVAGGAGCSALRSEKVHPGRVPKSMSLNLGNGLKMELVLIPAGEFMMGSHQSPSELVAKYGGKEEFYQDEQPRHPVKIDKAFYLGRTEVTVGQFRRFTEATGYKTDAEKGGQDFEGGKTGGFAVRGDGTWGWREDVSWQYPGFQQNDDHPVVLVSWNDAKVFCAWLAQKVRRPIRLPTESEWEYACRGGTQTAFWWGDEPDDTGKAANVADREHRGAKKLPRVMPCDDGYRYTAPAGHYRANGFGLYDMTGNAWEWCEDWYEMYAGNTATNEWCGQKEHVIRGGSWDTDARFCRCSRRDGERPADRYCTLGFRVASGP